MTQSYTKKPQRSTEEFLRPLPKLTLYLFTFCYNKGLNGTRTCKGDTMNNEALR